MTLSKLLLVTELLLLLCFGCCQLLI